MSTQNSPLAGRLPDPVVLVAGATIVLAEVLLALWYALLTEATVAPEPFYGYPLVWITVALWGVWRVAPAGRGVESRRRLLAGAVAVGYLGVLAYVGGVVGLPTGANTGFRISTALPPGYGPALLYDGVVRAAVMPYRLVGYLALGYLLYATALDAAGAVLSGVVGLLSCVSCTFPVLAALAGGLVGGASAAAVQSNAYLLSTVVFVLTVWLLVARPFDRWFARLGLLRGT